MRRSLLPVVVAFTGAYVLSGCISFPPHYEKNPHAVVGYKCATLLPGSSDVLFIKNVSQVITRPRKDWWGIPPFMSYNWTFPEEGVWGKSFICSMNVSTGQKKVIREWPSDLCEPGTTYRVSRPMRKAVFSCHGSRRWSTQIVIFDLDALKWHILNLDSIPHTMPNLNALEMSPDEEEFAVVLCPEKPPMDQPSQIYGVAICDFTGRVRSLLNPDPIWTIRWMQKSDLIRIWVAGKGVMTVRPNDFSVVEELTGDHVPFAGTLPPGEDQSPLDVRFGSPHIGLGTPGNYKGSFSPSEAASLW